MNESTEDPPVTPSAWRTGRSVDGGIDRVPVPSTSGTMWLCGKHLIGPDPVATIDSLGVDTVVCLSQQHELVERYPTYIEWLANAGDHAIWHPIPDLHAPTLEETEHLVDEILRRLDLGHKVLVHCGAGIGRAGTIAAAVLIRRGVDLDRAIHTVASCRPMGGPEAGAQSDLLQMLADGR
ncbi:protein-tyrosine phosphatase family protein [Actinospongicola halichondriae]|uniref:protein-tyrosine phosphatase family protein n=1 Tax=Actinospongicola halichondriae TaxID=3236844 RepID=UPI003D54A127